MDKNEEKIKADQKKQQVVAENNKKAPPARRVWTEGKICLLIKVGLITSADEG